MSSHQIDYDTLLLDHAVGALPAAASLVVSVHVAMRDPALRQALFIDEIGACLLEGAPQAQLWSHPLPQRRTNLPSPQETKWSRAQVVIAAAGVETNSIAWRWRWFGLHEHALPVEGATLLRMAPGVSAPRHGHTADELTLVLSGTYQDETGSYGVGDLAIAGPDYAHRPRTPKDAGCVCLTASLAPAPKPRWHWNAPGRA
ncbi:MAG: cupin domain-containing protein [Caulobacterales bacterium]